MPTERLQKKKKATLAELAVGGGLLALFLPVIAFAVVWAVVGVALGAAYTFLIHDGGPTLWPMLVVYGGLLAAMGVVAYRFSARFLLLLRRLVGLLHERQRIRRETVPAALESSASEESEWDGQAAAATSRLRR